MKKLVLLLIFAGFACAANAQKIMDNKKNVQELKEVVEVYSVVVLTPQGSFALLNELGKFVFVDDNNKPIDLKTTTAVLNFMARHGWNYINTVGGNEGTPPQYIFKKRE